MAYLYLTGSGRLNRLPNNASIAPYNVKPVVIREVHMNISTHCRRKASFKILLLASAALAALAPVLAHADGASSDAVQMGVERVARFVPVGYRSPQAASDTVEQWVQVDLGASAKIDRIKVFPVVGWGGEGGSFPVRFKLALSDDPNFASETTLQDQTAADYPDPLDRVVVVSGIGAYGRYVRFVATHLRNRQFSLSKLEVWSNGKDIAEHKSITDSAKGILGAALLTRSPRAGGEEVVTDHPENVIPSSKWRPVPYKWEAPTRGITLDDGLFKSAMQQNITYLLTSFSVDELLRPFRERAGKPSPAGLRPPIPFWDTDLPGSNAGRFLMGAGNTLRWIDDPELRSRAKRIIDGIEECREPNGYIMAYRPDTIFYSERAAYTRTWVTRGLTEAGIGVDPKAFKLLRGYYDWFDTCEYLPELLRRAGQGVQGMIGSTRMYFTPLGKPEDLQTVQRYFQENYWLDQLAARDPQAIWRYPYDHPHNYLITSLEPYLDLYRATGARRYLDSAQGGWDLYHDDWEHVGGSIAICEGDTYEPKSYYLHRHTGELCGSVFWMRYNQRFHLLYPDKERYVNEIEKSIYNVLLANQVGSKGIRYHANLVGTKDSSTPISTNSCCEGQGTSGLGSIPEYLYSIAPDGFSVDMYAGSTIKWHQGNRAIRAHTATNFPFSPEVKISIDVGRPTDASIRIRVPQWAAANMPILVNGTEAVTGKPGSYAAVSRTWRNGDSITFTLPMAFRVTPYTGIERSSAPHYALEYGPILMALTGAVDAQGNATLAVPIEEFTKRLHPVDGKPLHFAIDGDTQRQYVPYWEVQDEPFTCYPAIGTGSAVASPKVEEGDLALASRGAVATSDSELASEWGSTAKAIDGIISSPEDFSNRWHSSIETPHPHWIQVKLPKPERVSRIVIRIADPAGHPVSFQGIITVNGKEHVVFDVKHFSDWREYRTLINPTVTDTFRLVIRESANPAYPNAAQVSEIELYKDRK